MPQSIESQAVRGCLLSATVPELAIFAATAIVAGRDLAHFVILGLSVGACGCESRQHVRRLVRYPLANFRLEAFPIVGRQPLRIEANSVVQGQSR